MFLLKELNLEKSIFFYGQTHRIRDKLTKKNIIVRRNSTSQMHTLAKRKAVHKGRVYEQCVFAQYGFQIDYMCRTFFIFESDQMYLNFDESIIDLCFFPLQLHRHCAPHPGAHLLQS